MSSYFGRFCPNLPGLGAAIRMAWLTVTAGGLAVTAKQFYRNFRNSVSKCVFMCFVYHLMSLKDRKVSQEG